MTTNKRQYDDYRKVVAELSKSSSLASSVPSMLIIFQATAQDVSSATPFSSLTTSGNATTSPNPTATSATPNPTATIATPTPAATGEVMESISSDTIIDRQSLNTQVIIAVFGGAIVVIAIVVFIIVRKKKKQPRERANSSPYRLGSTILEPTPKASTQPTMATNGSSEPRQRLASLIDDEVPNVHRWPHCHELKDLFGSPEPRQRLSSLIDDEVPDVELKHLRPHRLELKDLFVVGSQPLASGAFGEVWMGTYGRMQVAIKRLKSQEVHDVRAFVDEIILLSKFKSEYIVKFIGASWTRPVEMECVVEYMNLGDLRTYLANTSPKQFSWEKKHDSIASIVRGLMYLHVFSPQIIHRDLKSRNVLLDSEKGTKLADFGASRVAREHMTIGIGTFQWMAPEVILSTNYSVAADIYSFGVILSEFCTHKVPYENMRHANSREPMAQPYIVNEVCAGRLQPSFDGENVPKWVKVLGLQCVAFDPNKRPSALELTAYINKVKS